MKKGIALLLALCGLLFALMGCGTEEGEDKIRVLCTVFPLYDWARSVVGDSETVEVSLLVTNGTDLHSYQPSAADVMRIASADLFFYVGGPSDAWVEEVLRTQPSETRVDLAMMEIPDIILREISADSTLVCENEECHDHDHGTTDEHLWLSLSNAKLCAAAMTEELCRLNEAETANYRENLTNYTAELDKLHGEYSDATAQSTLPMLLFADRFPFVYLLEEYGIDYFAAFEGCSADPAATPETILRLAAVVDEHRLSVIMITENGMQDLAQSVRGATRAKDQTILSLNSMQSVTKSEIDLMARPSRTPERESVCSPSVK